MNIDRTLARLHFQPGTFTIRDGTPGFARGASFTPWRPSANWADCGFLLERYEVTLEPLTLPHPEGHSWMASTPDADYATADTAREAVVMAVIKHLEEARRHG